MRLVPDTDTVPNAVNKYLLPYEHQVITVRRHPAILLPPMAMATGGLLAAVAVIPLMQGNVSLELTVWLLTGILWAQLLWAAARWPQLYFLVTAKRVIFASGLFTTKMTQMPLEDVKRMTFRRSFGGRMLGYGTFLFESAGRPHTIVGYLPYPDQLYLEVSGLVFPGRKYDGDD